MTQLGRLSTALLRNQEQEALRDRVRLFAALTEFAAVANAILDPQRRDVVLLVRLDRDHARVLQRVAPAVRAGSW